MVKELGLQIELFLGREVDGLIDIDLLLESNTAQTMNHSNLVLLDFGMKKENIDEYCYELILKGYQPIIAHPERYTYITSNTDFKKWKETGALIQINAQSIFNAKSRKVRKKAKYLLKNNLVDFVASDCHGNTANYDQLLKANKYIEKRYKGNTLLKLVS